MDIWLLLKLVGYLFHFDLHVEQMTVLMGTSGELTTSWAAWNPVQDVLMLTSWSRIRFDVIFYLKTTLERISFSILILGTR